jgi:hypothetical protein
MVAHGDVEFELEADPGSKSAFWSKSEISSNLPASSPVTTSGSVTRLVSGLGGMMRRRWKDPVSSAVQTQAPKTKVSPRLKAIVGLDVDGSRRVRHVILGEIPYLARQLSVF